MHLKALITLFQKYLKNIKKDAESAEIYQSSSTSNSNISGTVTHSIINNTIFWKYVTRPFRCGM